MTYHRDPVASRGNTVVNVIGTTLTSPRKVVELVDIYVECVAPGSAVFPTSPVDRTGRYGVKSVVYPSYDV